ncbi:hypothetical protein [Bacteroides reticulotermitis]
MIRSNNRVFVNLSQGVLDCVITVVLGLSLGEKEKVIGMLVNFSGIPITF